MKKILILYVAEHRGHKSAAYNIAEAFKVRYPYNTEIKVLNAFQYLSPRLEKVLDNIYIFIIKHIPRLWGIMYDKKRLIDDVNKIRKFMNLFYFPKLQRLFSNFYPDVIVATQAFPCIVSADFKHKFGLNIPILGVITDYYPHYFWVNPYVDYYIVPTQEAKEKMIEKGVPDYKIVPIGIPVSVRFMQVYDREETSKHLGLDVDCKNILVMGGGLGIGPLNKIVHELDNLEIKKKFQIIVICGRNEGLYKKLKKKLNTFKHKVKLFGYIDFVNKIMDLSDIIITKAGGITTSEALCKGLGIIVINPIPGQEERNVRYLMDRGKIIKANNIKDVKCKVKELLEDENKIQQLRIKAKEDIFVDSSLRIADYIMSKIL